MFEKWLCDYSKSRGGRRGEVARFRLDVLLSALTLPIRRPSIIVHHRRRMINGSQLNQISEWKNVTRAFSAYRNRKSMKMTDKRPRAIHALSPQDYSISKSELKANAGVGNPHRNRRWRERKCRAHSRDNLYRILLLFQAWNATGAFRFA